VHKVYDTARTPYQRLLDSGVLTEAKRQELIYDATIPPSVTLYFDAIRAAGLPIWLVIHYFLIRFRQHYLAPEVMATP